MNRAPRTNANRRLPQRFLSDERGASLILFGLTIPVLVGVAGVAIDYSRAASMQSRIQQAADEAALASATLVRNGASQATAAAVAQNVFAANFGGFGGTASTPQVQFNVQGTQFTSSVSVQGSVKTTLGQVLGLSSVSAGANATAQASTGPTGGATMGQNLSGGGSIWGDPHLDYTSSSGASSSTTLTCAGGSWYNLLSDSAIQWNSVCLNDGSSLYFGGSQVKVGAHTVSFVPYQGPGFQGWTNAVDSFQDDCVLGVSTSINGSCGVAYAGTLVVDGQTIDPTQYQASTFTVVNDAGQSVTVKVQMSHHPLPAWFGTVPAGVHNYLAVDVADANYELTLVMPAGYQSAYATVSNAGMCGSPGGYFGAFIAGGNSVDLASYVVPGPTYQGGQFGWTAACGNTGGQIAHLIQ